MEKWSNLILLKRHRLNTKWRSLSAERRCQRAQERLCWLVVKRKMHHHFLGYFFQRSTNGKRVGGWGWGWEDAANVLVWVFLQYVLKSSTLNHADGIQSLTRHHADNYTFFTGFLLPLCCFVPPLLFFHSCVSVARSSGPLIFECLYRVSHPILQLFGPEIGSELWQHAFIPFIFSCLRKQRR